MDRFFHLMRAYPAVAGVGFFLAVVALLMIVLGLSMHRSGLSLRPLVFFGVFLLIVGGPQAAVHLTNAYLTPEAQPDNAPTGALELEPIPWERVFGSDADPDLITDAKRGLEAILADAEEAKLSFNTAGESALAARFSSPAAAAAAVERYGSFFQFAEASGSDNLGWTGRRFGGQGEWNHVVAAGNELYAWTAADRARVVDRRERALGPMIPALGADPPPAPNETATSWLTARPGLLAGCIFLNLALATGWFFKGSAWAARTDPASGATPLPAADLRAELLSLNSTEQPLTVTAGTRPDRIEINWRYADARWFDLMRAHRMKRSHKLSLELDESARKVRVTEHWSAFDVSAGARDLRLAWHAATGMQFFQFEKTTVLGVQLDAAGKPTGEFAKTFTFNLQAMKGPVIDVVTRSGWTWQPVMWRAPSALRWLTE